MSVTASTVAIAGESASGRSKAHARRANLLTRLIASCRIGSEPDRPSVMPRPATLWRATCWRSWRRGRPCPLGPSRSGAVRRGGGLGALPSPVALYEVLDQIHREAAVGGGPGPDHPEDRIDQQHQSTQSDDEAITHLVPGDPKPVANRTGEHPTHERGGHPRGGLGVQNGEERLSETSPPLRGRSVAPRSSR